MTAARGDRWSDTTAFWVCAAVIAICLWGSASPSMVFPLYLEQWKLQPDQIESVFALYPFTVAALMLLLGGLSDRIGRRRTILLGLVSLSIGTLVFAIAPSLPFLYAGRLFQAIGTATALGAATAALLEFEPQRRAARVSAVTVFATATGLVIALLISGALIEYGPAPLHLTYWFGLVLALVIAALATGLPDHPENARTARTRTALPHAAIFTGAVALISAYAIGALLLSLGAEIARELVGTADEALIGAVIALFAVAIGGGGRVFPRFAAGRTVAVGTVVSVAAMLVLLAAASVQNLALFAVSSLLSGFGFAAFLAAALAVVSQAAPAEAKAVTMSRLYATGYAVQGGLALVLGEIADVSLPLAIGIWAALVGAIGVAATVLIGRRTAASHTSTQAVDAGSR